jgi:hypothetical protein
MTKHKNKLSFLVAPVRPKLGSEGGSQEPNPYRLKAILWLILGLFIVLAALLSYLFWPKTTNNDQPTISNQPSSPQLDAGSLKPEATPTPPLATFDISIPYAPQAPFSNWTVHEESCEEAAIYMYRGYLESIQYPGSKIPDTEADTAFRAMKTWQVTNYGSEPDLTMTALGAFAKSYYGYRPVVVKNITADEIKTSVSDGHPVIVPVMTHSLENSMYGPISVYHVLLIKGYDANGVITNDAGVGNGIDKHYTWDIIWQAIDAQTAKMGQGREMLYLTR